MLEVARLENEASKVEAAAQQQENAAQQAELARAVKEAAAADENARLAKEALQQSRQAQAASIDPQQAALLQAEAVRLLAAPPCFPLRMRSALLILSPGRQAGRQAGRQVGSLDGKNTHGWHSLNPEMEWCISERQEAHGRSGACGQPSQQYEPPALGERRVLEYLRSVPQSSLGWLEPPEVPPPVSRRFPCNTGCLPLNYSGNPGRGLTGKRSG